MEVLHIMVDFSSCNNDLFFTPYRYEIGPALYLGWSGALLDVVGGALLCCSYKTQVSSAKNKYSYRAPGLNTVSSAKAGPQAALPRYDSNNSICKYGKNAYV
ncbi:hypothetical protein FKM82_025335 [Ascaphus truei]